VLKKGHVDGHINDIAAKDGCMYSSRDFFYLFLSLPIKHQAQKQLTAVYCLVVLIDN
jgi:hypothetical protein